MRLPFSTLFLAIAIAVALPAWTTHAQSPDELIRSALAAEDRGQIAEAIELHKAVIAAQPDNVRSLNSIAGLYGKQGQYREEIAWAKKALAIDERHAPSWLNLGTGHFALGELPQAMAAYKNAVATDPYNPATHYHLALVNEEMGDLPAAEKHYEDAVGADAKFEAAYFNLGALNARQGRFLKASSWLNRLLEINFGDLDARKMLEQIQAVRSGQSNPADSSPIFATGQVWSGKYVCGQGQTDLVLRIKQVEGLRVSAVFEFAVSAEITGSFHIQGEYQPEKRRIAFQAGDWISQPAGYTQVGLLGHVDRSGGVIAGVVDARGCSSFAVTSFSD